MSRRIERVNEQIKEEIAALVQREMQDPRLRGLISITGVTTSPDLHYATVRVSVLGSEEDVQQVMTALRHAAGFLRREIASRLRLKHAPELSFKLDTSMEQGARVLELLREIQKGER
ncbi:MAG: 30S ribosome-binding factor RbfA [Sphingomonadaceae bacterium]